MKRPPRGFTLIELLFVVATIAVLAAIAVPNFLEAQTRSKIARTKVDMSVLEYGLRSYYADHNAYPTHRPEVREFLGECARLGAVTPDTTSTPLEARYSWFAQEEGQPNSRPGDVEFFSKEKDYNRGYYPILNLAAWDLQVLTTPLSYIGTELPRDIFGYHRNAPYTYINPFDLPSTSTQRRAEPGNFKRYLLFSYGPGEGASKPGFKNPVKGPWIPYEPTNGTMSSGLILVTGNHAAAVPSTELTQTETSVILEAEQWPMGYRIEPTPHPL